MITVHFNKEMTDWAIAMVLNLTQAGYKAVTREMEADLPEAFSLKSNFDMSDDEKKAVLDLVHQTFEDLDMDYRVID